MAAKKREIYGCFGTQLRTHDRCRVAERICPGAMGLYLFLTLQARGEETCGDSSEEAAYESWGAPVAYRKKQLRALIEAGLVEFRDGRPHVLKYEEHNDTPDVIAANRKAARERKGKSRGQATVTRDMGVTSTVTAPVGHAEVPSSISISDSGLDLSGESRGGEAPPWWPGAVAAAEQAVGAIDSPQARWLEYSASRARKGWASNHRDAVGWLSTVIRDERKRHAKNGPKSGEITKQPYDPDAPWIKLGDTGS